MDAVPIFADVYIEIVDTAKPPSKKETADQTLKHYSVINRHNLTSPALPLNHCEPFVIPRDNSLREETAVESRARKTTS